MIDSSKLSNLEMQLTDWSITSIIFFSAHTCTDWLKELETIFQLARYDIQAEDPSPSVMALHRQKYPGIYPSNCRKENVKLQGKI